jgi:hypothetical protein
MHMSMLRILVSLASLAATLAAADFTGTWQAALVDPKDKNQPASPVPFAPQFELRMEGSEVSGIAHLGVWLGDAKLSAVKVDGDTISFVTTAETESTLGRVVTHWTGTLRGEQLELTMHFARGVKLIATKSPK